MSDTDIIYPIIERLVNEVYQRTHGSVDRDKIALLLLKDKIAKPVVVESLGGKRFTEEDLWNKSANYVDCLTADITTVKKYWRKGITRIPIRNQIAIDLALTLDLLRAKPLHPFTKKTHEVYSLIPAAHSLDDNVAKDINQVEHDKTLSETERKRLINARLGQGQFREDLKKYWNQKCAVTGCKETSLLRASHIKSWHDSNNQERLDLFNGLLLIPNLDAAFDRYAITFDENGHVRISTWLSENDAALLGINSGLNLIKLDKRHEKYMKYHREEFSKRETLRAAKKSI